MEEQKAKRIIQIYELKVQITFFMELTNNQWLL